MITNIRLQNFRSYKDYSIEFEPGANIIVGPNASGKTNLLEGVMVLAQGGSYRSKGSNLIRREAEWARLDGFFESQNRSVKLEGTEDKITRTFAIGDREYRRLGLDQTWPIVYFEPEHLQSIIRGPEKRREYFDDLLSRSTPGYKQLLNSYNRTLAQRNSLLKKGHRLAAQQIFAWNVRLGGLGAQIANHRQELTEHLAGDLGSVYRQIAGDKTPAAISYQACLPHDNYASRMISALERNLGKDLERGFTGTGPHREDFSLTINQKPINEGASRGEIHSLLLSLKRIELQIIERARQQKPILLLDDVLSELDGSRRQALVEMLADHQAILTTTDADTVLDYFARGSHKLLALTK